MISHPLCLMIRENQTKRCPTRWYRFFAVFLPRELMVTTYILLHCGNRPQQLLKSCRYHYFYLHTSEFHTSQVSKKPYFARIITHMLCKVSCSAWERQALKSRIFLVRTVPHTVAPPISKRAAGAGGPAKGLAAAARAAAPPWGRGGMTSACHCTARTGRGAARARRTCDRC